MNNNYEALIVFKPFIDADNPEQIVRIIDSAIKKADGKLKKVEKLGRKRLAYEINNFKDGFLATALMEVDSGQIENFKKAFEHNDDVLRLTILKLDKVALQSILNPRPPREHQRGDRPAPGGEHRGPRPHYQQQQQQQGGRR